jgi:hypothetical protein
MMRDIARSATFFALTCNSRFQWFFFMRAHAAANRASTTVKSKRRLLGSFNHGIYG